MNTDDTPPAAEPPAASGARAGPAAAAAGAPARGSGVRTAAAAAGRAVAALGANLALALRLLAGRRVAAAAWRATPGALVLLFALHLLIGLGYDLYAVGWRDSHIDLLALPSVSFWALGALLGAVLLAALRAPSDAPEHPPAPALVLAAAAFALVCWESLAGTLLAVAADFSPTLDRLYEIFSWAPLLWIALALALAAVRLTRADNRARRLGIGVVAAASLLVPQWAIDPAVRLWVANAADAADGGTGPDAAQGEQTLYGQFDLLGDALDAISPGQEGVTELFTISFAGDGTQDVFLSEAVGADAVLADVFDSGEHSLILANSVTHPQEHPFATVSALERSLAEVASRMNLDEDVLTLVITSHGTPDHHLSIALPPYQFDDLTPERLRGLLDDAGIRFRVIIISACYSGGFIDALAGPDTMVITASSAGQASFGCRAGTQWTDFGRAYFAEALAQAASFEGAFHIARGRIAEREAAEGLSPSDPQLFVGPGIREQLQRLETRRGARILFARSAAAADSSAPCAKPVR